MTTPDDGGPAFPFAGFENDAEYHGPAYGMSLRDYFAASALSRLAFLPHPHDNHEEKVAENCYSYADAMLKERDK